MWRKVEFLKRLRFASVMLVAFLLVMSQARISAAPDKTTGDTGKALSFQQGLDAAISYGLVQDDTQLAIPFLLAVALVLSFFLFRESVKPHTTTTSVLSRNFCCIVPKGP